VHAENARYGRRYDDLPIGTLDGVPSGDLCFARWTVPTAYRLRLRATIGAGTASTITVSHRFFVDDGIGDGERLITLTTSLASGLGGEAYTVVEGVALSMRVRVETLPDGSPQGTPYRCLTSAAVAEIL